METLDEIEVTGSSDLNIFKNHQNHAPVYVQDQKRQTSSKVFFSGKTSSQSKEIIFTKGFDVSGDSDNFPGSKSISYGMYKNKEKIKPKESTAQNINPHAESYFPFYDGENLTFRTDDTTKIDAITIDSNMLDENIKIEKEEKELQELKNIVLR